MIKDKNNDLGLLILRFAVGALMLFHGISKIGALGMIEGILASKGLPTAMAYGVYITEIIAPLLILIGYRTRLSSLVYVSGCIFAFLLVHTRDFFALNDHGGWKIELLGLYTLGAVALFFTGGGKYATSTSNRWD
ncbi:DoxX family protein [Prolixibacteraceae bacterium]|nr:DoxX family protein [Prolixibacteraceae bacterium]